MHEAYHAYGTPNVCPYLVAVYEREDKAVLLAPPALPSLFYRKGQWLDVVPSSLSLIEDTLGKDAFRVPSRIFPVLTFLMNGVWSIWTTQGLIKKETSSWYDVLRGTREPIIFDGWPEAILFSDALAAWGYWDDLSDTTVQKRLNAHSNEYWLMDRLCAFLAGLDIVDGDALPSDWNQASGSLSVVIPCYNSADTIAYTLDAFATATSPLPKGVVCEIILIDDGSTVPLQVEDQSLPCNMQLVRAHRRYSSSTARNIGLAIAQGDVILFLDSDICVAPNYLLNHWVRHRLFPGALLISLRENLPPGGLPPVRMPSYRLDTRWKATYEPAWKGLVTVTETVTVQPLLETGHFRHFGYGRHLGPTDLPFMVKGNNFSLQRRTCLPIRFPPHFKGWGPEDVCFAAKVIAAKGVFVVPVLSTGVFHLYHPLRSGSKEQQEQELIANLQHYQRALQLSPHEDWSEG